MIIFLPDFHMTGCFPPPSGAPQPSARSQRTISRHLIGFGILLSIQVDAVDDGEIISMAETDDDPGLQSLAKFVATFFQGSSFPPSSLTRRNQSEKVAVLHQFIMRMAHRLSNVVAQHTSTRQNHTHLQKQSQELTRFQW